MKYFGNIIHYILPSVATYCNLLRYAFRLGVDVKSLISLLVHY
jgi:hypothetical protein